jgi:hypothetical protein
MDSGAEGAFRLGFDFRVRLEFHGSSVADLRLLNVSAQSFLKNDGINVASALSPL